MLWVIRLIDKPKSTAIRAEHQAAHSECYGGTEGSCAATRRIGNGPMKKLGARAPSHFFASFN
jgi:hypothetical protein